MYLEMTLVVIQFGCYTVQQNNQEEKNNVISHSIYTVHV